MCTLQELADKDAIDNRSRSQEPLRELLWLIYLAYR